MGHRVLFRRWIRPLAALNLAERGLERCVKCRKGLRPSPIRICLLPLPANMKWDTDPPRLINTLQRSPGI